MRPVDRERFLSAFPKLLCTHESTYRVCDDCIEERVQKALKYATALVEQRIPLEGPAYRPLLEEDVRILRALAASRPSEPAVPAEPRWFVERCDPNCDGQMQIHVFNTEAEAREIERIWDRQDSKGLNVWAASRASGVSAEGAQTYDDVAVAVDSVLTQSYAPGQNRDDLRAALLKAWAGASGVSEGWQPIAAADADTPVLLYTPRERLTDLPVHIAPEIRADIRVSAPRYWTWATHWMPLPAAPAQPVQGEASPSPEAR